MDGLLVGGDLLQNHQTKEYSARRTNRLFFQDQLNQRRFSQKNGQPVTPESSDQRIFSQKNGRLLIQDQLNQRIFRQKNRPPFTPGSVKSKNIQLEEQKPWHGGGGAGAWGRGSGGGGKNKKKLQGHLLLNESLLSFAWRLEERYFFSCQIRKASEAETTVFSKINRCVSKKEQLRVVQHSILNDVGSSNHDWPIGAVLY